MSRYIRILLIVVIAVISVGIMFWFKKKHDKIRVEFIEKGKDRPFAVSMVPIGQLPDSFEIETSLSISGKEWSVVAATPKNKSDFEKSGQLKIVLSQVMMVNPRDIMFSIPTINDKMCELKKADSLEGLLVIHEDDWRQFEFIAESQVPKIETEMEGIQNIYETKQKGGVFTTLHTRKLIETPLGDSGISYPALKKFFNIAKEFNGFGIRSYKAVAERGFAFETKDGLQVYGVLSDAGKVEFLCLANSKGLAECQEMMDAFHLVLVDWCKMQTRRKSAD